MTATADQAHFGSPVLDVTDKSALDAAFDRFAPKPNRCQRLVDRAIENHELARWPRVIDIGLNAALPGVQVSAPHMSPWGRGRIAVTAWAAAV